MRKRIAVYCLLALCLLLCGCSGGTDTAPDAAALPPVEMPKPQASGPLEDAAQKVLAPFQGALERLAEQNPLCIAHTIPGGMLYQMAGDAQRLSVQPENGRYRFSDVRSSVSVYQATGLEVTADMARATRDPMNEAPMGEGSVSDLSVTGGGLYERRYAYDAAQDLTSGMIEIEETLDGESTGRERFRYSVAGGELCFVDAASEMTLQGNDLENAGAYLVTVGRVRKDGAEIIEYLVRDEGAIPTLGEEGWFTVPNGAEVQGHYRT